MVLQTKKNAPFEDVAFPFSEKNIQNGGVVDVNEDQVTLEVEDNAHVLSDLGASRVPFWPKVRVLSKVKQIPQKVCLKSQIHFTAILNKYTNKFSYSCPCLVVEYTEELISRTFLDENRFR